ncbi:unnamed protein product [Lactuca virosa]|uniref:No apical meristem-associated C-terminal domain-containing protein n=1 Tax=Lactuca virosa TaxID=75947 RepID=A0AAU9P201_9ASTR|nr:unnamed protein product [Lactuca virosa]
MILRQEEVVVGYTAGDRAVLAVPSGNVTMNSRLNNLEALFIRTESDSSSNEPASERNEEDGELQPISEKEHNYTDRQKSKKLVELKELSLARAYVDCLQGKQCINQQRMNTLASGRYEADVLKVSQSECEGLLIRKLFLMQKAWEWLKDHAKWELVPKVCENLSPPSSKQTKISSSNTYTTSSDAHYPPRPPNNNNRLMLKTHHLREK